jgi:(aminoalkyl)phosphonate N-acetyltransferase
MSSVNITLRPAVPRDVEIIYTFICELEETTFDKENFRNVYNVILANQYNVLTLAVHNETVVGFISCHFQPLLHHGGIVGEIQELFVKPEARNMGIGKLLIANVLNKARKKGALQVEVTANLSRKETHEFYLKEGFQYTHKKFVVDLDNLR